MAQKAPFRPKGFLSCSMISIFLSNGYWWHSLGDGKGLYYLRC